MPLPEAFQDHINNAESRLESVKRNVDRGSFGPEAVEAHTRIITAELLLAGAILVGVLTEEDMDH